MDTNINPQESQATELSIAKNGKAVKLPEAFNAAQIALLTQRSPSNLIRKRKGSAGKELSYLPHNFVTEMLNQAFGFAWSFHTEVIAISEKECTVKGRIVVHNKSQEITKEQYGSQLVLKGMATGDALKGAGSDALRKCASLLGIGLDLYGEEHTEEPAPQANTRFKTSPDDLVNANDLDRLTKHIHSTVARVGRELFTNQEFEERLGLWCNRKWGLESWKALLKWQYSELMDSIPALVQRMRDEVKKTDEPKSEVQEQHEESVIAYLGGGQSTKGT